MRSLVCSLWAGASKRCFWKDCKSSAGELWVTCQHHFPLRCTARLAGAYYPSPTARKNILNCKCQIKHPSVLYTLHPVQIRDEVWLHFVPVFPLSSFETCAFLKNWVRSWGNNILLPLLSLVGIQTALNTLNSDPTERKSTLGEE